VAANCQERIRRARINVRHACEMLLCPTPQALDQCSVLLETTARDLAGSRPEPDGNQSTLQEARLLHAAVRHARALLDSAFALRQAWSRRLGAITAGYTPGGEPARADPGFRLAVRG
jgi:hypothetical protein